MNHRERQREEEGERVHTSECLVVERDLAVGDEGDAVQRCSDGQWTSRRWQCRPLDRLGFGVE
jgi:hypothetical protein